MRQLNEDAVELNDFHAPNADTAAVVTIVADAAQFWVLDSIHFGYDKAPGAIETLVVTFGGVTVFTLYIPASDIAVAGPHEVLFPHGLYVGPDNKNEELKVTLSASTATTKGAVNITYR
jgi:hypothetical protein